jgi:hypothetical protein
VADYFGKPICPVLPGQVRLRAQGILKIGHFCCPCTEDAP